MRKNTELLARKCQPQVEALGTAEINALLKLAEGWQLDQAPAHARIVKRFDFKDYYQTLAFVNAIAYMVHAESHHPELVVTFNRCVVQFDTHSVNSGAGGLSVNDFICAAKVDALFQQAFS